ncbi:2OG-Fe(II) oxygenase [Methylomonas fluvii]|uniref:2OG-Fe(II) oxygenase n=1 Tax=Methylomonas fluvii TaxID=1854564 RepID=A0ABR9DJM6_9GAMM|nr:2OG-Fe(II) oxygenase [Methylomonas fluvii]MBD9362439.1 2OG-Fe(II) oxygenase [Methylomonas fluvii]
MIENQSDKVELGSNKRIMSLVVPSNPFDRLPPYCVVSDFLGEDLIEQLMAHVQSKERQFTPTQVGSGYSPEIRISSVLYDLGGLQETLQERFRAIAPQATADLGLLPFELERCEIELVAHGDGTFFKRHIDTRIYKPNAKIQRAMTGVLYFHRWPKGFCGGQLRLYPLNHSSENFIDIDPERDRLVLFPAWAPHEVMPISCPSDQFADSRFAINCWYCRPAPHSNGLSET